MPAAGLLLYNMCIYLGLLYIYITLFYIKYSHSSVHHVMIYTQELDNEIKEFNCYRCPSIYILGYTSLLRLWYILHNSERGGSKKESPNSVLFWVYTTIRIIYKVYRYISNDGCARRARDMKHTRPAGRCPGNHLQNTQRSIVWHFVCAAVLC